ncbi:MAG: ribbon-helix-helix protein, CopG family [Thermoplasmata archaeon]|nr:ribbon-helix-helix protein, CopG family [Thermoplasmata archaeon]
MEIDEKVSVRFQTRELNELDNIVEALDFPSRSDFIRVAVKNQRELMEKKSSICVEFPPLILGYIDVLVNKGYYTSREDALKKIFAECFNIEIIEKAIKATKILEQASGCSVDIIKKTEQIIEK